MALALFSSQTGSEKGKYNAKSSFVDLCVTWDTVEINFKINFNFKKTFEETRDGWSSLCIDPDLTYFGTMFFFISMIFFYTRQHWSKGNAGKKWIKKENNYKLTITSKI